MSEHPFGWLSLTPPLLAIAFAIATRRVVPSLLFGVLLGSLLLATFPRVPSDEVFRQLDADLAQAVVDLDYGKAATIQQRIAELREPPGDIWSRAANDFFEVRLWGSLSDESHLRVFIFTALMGAMIGVIQRSGGMQDAVSRLAPLSGSRRGGQILTWCLGLLVFIDDYANSLLLGNTMRPLCDRLKISREKLAYIVDSTAAPVSGLALVSTWVAGEIANIEEGLRGLEFAGEGVEAFGLFLQTIPYRFYVLWALLFVPLNAWLRRDFGPMLAAERNALRGGSGEEAARAPAADRSRKPEPAGHWIDAAAPILITVSLVVWLLYMTGKASAGELSSGLRGWGQIFGNGDSNLALVYGSLAGLIVAAVLARRRGMTAGRISTAAIQGARFVLSALAILWLAWALSDLTSDDALATGAYLAATLKGAIGLWLLPTAVFALAFLVAFSTGTSWGTMSMLMPLVIQTTYALLQQDGPVVGSETALVASVGGVLAGAIFGDHCSPISDTTVLSSNASGCNHIAHVWTQMPYAMLVGGIAIVCGTLPVGLGMSVWFTTPLALVAMVAFLLIVGRNPEVAIKE
jgi:Na+/H+ antiporter NhaC